MSDNDTLPAPLRTRPIEDLLVECFTGSKINVERHEKLRGKKLHVDYVCGRHNPLPAELEFEIEEVTAYGTILTFIGVVHAIDHRCRLQWESSTESWVWRSLEDDGYCLEATRVTLIED